MKPTHCQICRAAPPTGRFGAYWACGVCAGDRIVFCAEGQHDWGGAVDTHGTNVWCCRRRECGAILGHQAITTDVVEAAPETGYIDC